MPNVLKEEFSPIAKLALRLHVVESLGSGTLLVAGIRKENNGPISLVVGEQAQGKVRATGTGAVSFESLDSKGANQLANQVQATGNTLEEVVAIGLIQPRSNTPSELSDALYPSKAEIVLLKTFGDKFPNLQSYFIAGNTADGPKAFLKKNNERNVLEVDLNGNLSFSEK